MKNIALDNTSLPKDGEESQNTSLIKVEVRVKQGENKADLHGFVTTVINNLVLRPLSFKAECTASQLTALMDDSRVDAVINLDELAESLTTDVTKITPVRRDSRTAPLNTFDVEGNWGLIRHQSQTNNFSSMDTITTATYTHPQDGTGIDLVHIGTSISSLQDPEFQTNGVSRIQQYQWSSVDSGAPTIDYSSSADIDRHAEMVLQCAAGNTMGRATGAQIYCWPADQMGDGGYQVYDAFDHIKAFHEAKSNNRPTVVVLAMSYTITPAYSRADSLFYREKKYTTVSPSGSGDAHVSQLSNQPQKSFPATDGEKFTIGSYDAANQLTNFVNVLATGTDAEIKAWFETNGDQVGKILSDAQGMMDAGVHFVVSAGNYSHAVQLEGHPDYHNKFIAYSKPAVGSSTSPYLAAYGTNQRGGMLNCKDAISVAAMDSDFGYGGGTETLAPFSNRGEAVDCCAAGNNLIWTLYGQSSDYVNNPYKARGGGTSFSAPQVAGMVCQVLEKYPTTTPKQMRRYFREEAVGTDKLWDVSVAPKESDKFGDAAYLGSNGLQGYSGNIAYLDPNLTFDPTTLPDTSVTQSSVSSTDRSLNYSTAEINTKLSNVT